MDKVTEQISAFATAMTFENLPTAVVEAANTRIVDTIGCALGAVQSESVKIAFRAAEALGTGENRARVLGQSATSLPMDMAAFVNTTMIRSLDLNDWSPNGHPSDTLGAFVAFADSEKINGRQLVAATTVAYEVFMQLTRQMRMHSRGWDQGLAMGLGTVAGLGNLLDLDQETIATALSLVAVSGVSTRATRTGELSMWKGCATAYSVRNAVFAVLLARSGLTGPPEPFEGRAGIFELITGPFEFVPATVSGEKFAISRSALKAWPACYHTQASLWAASELAEQTAVEDIESIDIGTHAEGWRGTGSEPEKWSPQTRETADHSTPYVVARLLLDGGLTHESFDTAALIEPRAKDLMARIAVHESEEATLAYPDDIISILTAKTRDGEIRQIKLVNPQGHPHNPMARSTVRTKFLDLVGPTLGIDRGNSAFESWEHIASQDSLTAPLDLLIAGGAVALENPIDSPVTGGLA